MSVWFKDVQLGLALSQVLLPHLTESTLSFLIGLCEQGHCHVGIEKDPVQTVDIKLQSHNSVEYHHIQ